MAITIKFKGKEFGLQIPVMPVNLINNRYSTTGLHQFSRCCKAKVNHKKVCSDCEKQVLNPDILKGFDEDTILSDSQAEQLKEFLDNGVLEVLDIADIQENFYYQIIPFTQKTQILFPSVSKSYNKQDIKAFYSFKSALKDLNKFCLAKLSQRSTEHLVLLFNYDDNLMLLEIPFESYKNLEEINRLKDGIAKELELEKIRELDSYKPQAIEFIKKFKGKTQIESVKEEKAILLKEMINDIQNGVEKPIEIKVKSKESNPFE